MSSTIAQHRIPPAPSSKSPGAKSSAAFTVLLLCFAVTFILVCRDHGPAFLQSWFAPLPFGNLDVIPVQLGLLCAAIFSAVIAHESGHFAAAYLLGFHFLGASIGPIEVRTLHGKWALSFSPKRLFTGSISAIPASMHRWRAGMMIVVASGPFATLLAALMVARLSHPNAAAGFFQSAFMQISLIIFALGFIPNKSSSARRNDARIFLDLALENASVHELELFIRLTQLVVEGVPPQDYPVELVSELAAWRGRTQTECIFAQALSRWALDSDNIQLADAWDSRALSLSEHCDPRTRNTALASSACFDVLYRRQSEQHELCQDHLEAAREKFARVDLDALFPKCLEHRARAFRHVAMGHARYAPGEIIRAQYALPKGIPAYNLERGLLATLHTLVLLKPERKLRASSLSCVAGQ